MPRRGSFGRRRGGSSNLASLVASLLKEQRAAQDRVMFDAYQNGGLVDGKPVTDARILSYMKGRRDGFTADDPLWTEWDNRVRQTSFSIDEQKIGLSFRQGKVGAGAVAAFYREHLRSIDKDSAFYREVAGRAADWAKSASASARGAARGRAESGVRDKLNSLINRAAEYDALETALTEYAKREGLISGSQTIADADATSLQEMFDRGIYAGEERITLDSFREAAAANYKNLDTQVRLQVKLGNQGIEARNKRDRFRSDTILRLNVVDERAQYEMARDAWLSAVEVDPGNPWAVAAANERYAQELNAIHGNANTPDNDPEFLGGLINEANAVTSGQNTGPTVAELYGESGDAKSTADATTAMYADLDALDGNRAYYGQAEPGGPMKVIPWDGPSSMGMDDSLQPMVVSVNGQRRIAYLAGEPVHAVAVMPAGGSEPVDPAQLSPEALRLGLANGGLELADGPRVGYVFRNGDFTRYGVVDPVSGTMLFTQSNPWTTEPTAGIGDGTLAVLSSTIDRSPSPTGWRYSVESPLARPVSIDTMDPMLADSTVAPKDLLALIDLGIKNQDYTAEDVGAWKQRLQQREQARLRSLSNRDLGLQDRMGIGDVGYNGEILDPRDVRKSVLDGMDAVRDATKQIFGPFRTEGRISDGPPAAPTPPKPTPGFAPPPLEVPKPIVSNPGIKREDEFDPPTPPKVTTGNQYAKEGPGGFSHR